MSTGKHKHSIDNSSGDIEQQPLSKRRKTHQDKKSADEKANNNNSNQHQQHHQHDNNSKKDDVVPLPHPHPNALEESKKDHIFDHRDMADDHEHGDGQAPFAMIWDHLDFFYEHQTLEEFVSLNEVEAKAKSLAQAKGKATSPEKKRKNAPPQLQFFTLGHSASDFNEEKVRAMIEKFKQGMILNYDDAKAIVEKAMEIHTKQPNITRINIDESTVTVPHEASSTSSPQSQPAPAAMINVVGDIHGQLSDVLEIFNGLGFPAPNNNFLFNGDFVDRGINGVEVLLTLYSMKIAFSHNITLNRGNHEARSMNSKYHFEDEVTEKYDSDFFELIQKSFYALPLLSIINKKVVVMHGGLFHDDKITLDDIDAKIDRFQDPPTHSIDPFDIAFADILWSDPRPIEGREGSTRGAGVYFGESVTKSFLERNGLQLLIRSHEVVDEGFEWMHSNMVLTIFSASNYCGTKDNKGAVIRLNFVTEKKENQHHGTTKINHKIFQYQSSPPPTTSKTSKEDTLRLLKELIFIKKKILRSKFHELDPQRTGTVMGSDWCNVLKEVLCLNIPWDSLIQYLVDSKFANITRTSSKTTPIHYRHFLDRYHIRIQQDVEAKYEEMLSEICVKISDKLDTIKVSLNQSAKDGFVTIDSFISSLKNIDVGISDSTIRDLAETLDVQREGYVEVKQFLDKFQDMTSKLIAKNDQENSKKEWMKAALKDISKGIYTTYDSAKAAFENIDENNNGRISKREFSKALKTLPLKHALSHEQRYELADLVDDDGDGQIDYAEFVHSIRPMSTHAFWNQRIIERLSTWLFIHRFHLKRIFRAFDKDSSGKINFEEFKQGLIELNDKLKTSTLAHLEDLFYLLDMNKDGFVDFLELASFVESIVIVDKQSEHHHHHHHGDDDAKKEKKKEKKSKEKKSSASK